MLRTWNTPKDLKLKTRINEHCNNINKNTASPSVITEHRMQYNHEWEDIKIPL